MTAVPRKYDSNKAKFIELRAQRWRELASEVNSLERRTYRAMRKADAEKEIERGKRQLYFDKFGEWPD